MLLNWKNLKENIIFDATTSIIINYVMMYGFLVQPNTKYKHQSKLSLRPGQGMLDGVTLLEWISWFSHWSLPTNDW